MSYQIETKNGVVIYEIVGQRPNHTYLGEFENVDLLMDQMGNIIDIDPGNLSGLKKQLNSNEIKKIENLIAKLEQHLLQALPKDHVLITKLQQ